ncbi:MAG: phosphatidate cytidylyltransferase [Steroidobacteraceae bacterium]
MLQRIVSALVLGVLLIAAVLWLPALASTVVLSLLLAAAAWEWSALIGAAGLGQRLLFLLAAAAVCAGLWIFTAAPSGLAAALWCAAGFWILAAMWVWGWPQAVNRPLSWVAGLVALPLAWLALARMRLDWHLGEYWVLYALCIVWTADSGAYFAGRAWGRRKLAPRVSPGKTWAGLWGGLALAALLAVFATSWLSRSAPALIVLTVVVAFFSVVGDLTESLFKRHAGVKDSGRLIPGHGGVLDRFDSLLAAAPLLMLGASYLGRLP